MSDHGDSIIIDLMEADHAGRWAITAWNPALRRVSVEPDTAGCAPADASLCSVTATATLALK